MTWRRAVAALVAVCAVGVAALSACGDDPPAECPTGPVARGLAVAVGGHTGGGQPDLPPSLDRTLSAAVDQAYAAAQKGSTGADVPGATLVRVDGHPTVGCVVRPDVTAGNSTSRDDARQNFINAVRTQVQTLTAVQPESDPLAALELAAVSAGPGGTVVLVDSGLQTVVPLDFAKHPELLTAGIDPLIDQLRAAGALPDLHDRHVIITGVGYTSAPQDQPGIARQHHLIELWRRIAAATGGDVEVIQAPLGPALPDLPQVAVVPMPPQADVAVGCDTDAILADDGPVGFTPGQTGFREPGTAREGLTRFATWLRDNPTARVHVIGSIAHYGDNTTTGLSRDRAVTVADQLRLFGVDAGRITTDGAGWGPYPNPTAPPDDADDILNRRVILEMRCQ